MDNQIRFSKPNPKKRSNWPILLGIIVFFVFFSWVSSRMLNANVEETIPISETYRTSDFPIESDKLIGIMYPPKAGPLHRNFEFPPASCDCPDPFVAIYEDEPYLQYMNTSPPCV